MNVSPPWRVPLLVLGFVGLAAGVGGGLARLGFGLPAPAELHGPLMIGGFFGVVISLERAVAIGRMWAYAGPLLAGLGTAFALHGAPAVARWLVLAASVVLLAASLDVLRRQRAMFTATLVLGAACWCLGNLLWALGWPVHEVVIGWLAFLLLTIAGERLELSRFLPPSPLATRVFAAIVAAMLASLLSARAAWGAPLFAGAALALALWLLKQDIARRTVRQRGLTRYIAVCLLAGYAWLAVGAVIILAAGAFTPGTRAYDAALHAIALGFVFSMVFGHAPIIFPAVLKVAVPYHPGFYAPLVLLHASLALRLAGDAAGHSAAVRIGALLNAIALAAFIVGTALAVLRGRAGRPGVRATRQP